jgi:hypothetical protein
MVIVSARRTDLRQEISMADEAFALSPIHARAALPTDADYDAIQEAFMETSRGRWFLTEYAKRNRNADTRMVLDAVERLEAGLASQRAQAETAAAEAAAVQVAAVQAAVQQAAAAQAEIQQAAAAQAAAVQAAPPVDIWPELAKAFTRARMEIAQRLVRDSNEEAFETIRASTETLKSISWALRERGFDARICDFLDVQVNKITDGYTGLMAESSVAGDTEAEILATFDELIQHVEGLTSSGDAELESLDIVVDAVADAMSEDDDLPMPPEDDELEPAPALIDEPPAAVIADTASVEIVAEAVSAPSKLAETAQEIAAAADAAPEEVEDPDAAFRAIYGDESDIEIVDTAPHEEPAALPPSSVPPAPVIHSEPEINKQRLYEAKLGPYRKSENSLQVVAPADDIEIVDIASAEAPSAPHRSPIVEAPAVAEIAPMPAPVDVATEAPATEPPKPSLGQALLDSGMIAKTPSRTDPLSPFRRMSQAEKVAFFT